MNFDRYLFHCSSIGEIMTEPRSGKGLSETAKAHLLEIWIREKYGRTKTDTNKYVEKGLQQEEDGITLYSLVSRKMFKKNQETFENDFICGTPDIIHDGSVRDIKCSWSIHTFFANFHKPLNKDYLYQINGYMALLSLEVGKLVYVLVNTPDALIEAEKSKLRYRMGLIDPEADGVYVMASAEIERNGIFDDIPKDERWLEFDVPKMDMQPVYDRVIQCRDFLTKLS